MAQLQGYDPAITEWARPLIELQALFSPVLDFPLISSNSVQLKQEREEPVSYAH